MYTKYSQYSNYYTPFFFFYIIDVLYLAFFIENAAVEGLKSVFTNFNYEN